jgi:hypothetical protein
VIDWTSMLCCKHRSGGGVQSEMKLDNRGGSAGRPAMHVAMANHACQVDPPKKPEGDHTITASSKATENVKDCIPADPPGAFLGNGPAVDNHT